MKNDINAAFQAVKRAVKDFNISPYINTPVRLPDTTVGDVGSKIKQNIGTSIDRTNSFYSLIGRDPDTLTPEEKAVLNEGYQEMILPIGSIKNVAGKEVAEQILNKDKVKSKVAQQIKEKLDKSVGKSIQPKFEGLQDLSTKVIEDMKGLREVPEQHIRNLLKTPGVKQGEKEAIERMLTKYSQQAKQGVGDIVEKGYSPLKQIEDFKSAVGSRYAEENTARLKQLGIEPDENGLITLYRGTSSEPKDAYRSWSYWTTDAKIAKTFGPNVHEVKVPVGEVVANSSMDKGGNLTFQNPLNLVKQKGNIYSVEPRFSQQAKQGVGDDLERQAIRNVGTTSKEADALYISSDGRLLGGKGLSDHSSFANKALGTRESVVSQATLRNSGMLEMASFPNRSEVNIRIHKDPTPSQIDTIKRLVSDKRNVYIDDYRGATRPDLPARSYTKDNLDEFFKPNVAQQPKGEIEQIIKRVGLAKNPNKNK